MHHVDPETIAELRDLLDEELDAIMLAFAQQLPVQLERLEQASPSECGALAHALKGSAGNIGATMLAGAAGALEQAARTGEPEAIAAARARLCPLANATLDELRALGALREAP
ncbi:Hpt domain-containing protein [Marichromatium gracile]|nr:Hpt domain-containing protein [Marichromatium gracile]